MTLEKGFNGFMCLNNSDNGLNEYEKIHLINYVLFSKKLLNDTGLVKEVENSFRDYLNKRNKQNNHSICSIDIEKTLYGLFLALNITDNELRKIKLKNFKLYNETKKWKEYINLYNSENIGNIVKHVAEGVSKFIEPKKEEYKINYGIVSNLAISTNT